MSSNADEKGIGKNIPENAFEEETIKKKRKFPVWYTAVLGGLIALQVILLLLILFLPMQPKDVIENYEVTVEPNENGTLDISYAFDWVALDSSEPLTWVEIGVPNRNFTISDYSRSTVERAQKSVSESDAYVKLIFREEYRGGERVHFEFRINQQTVLTDKNGDCYYEFIPGWFNAIRVEKYTFRWKLDGQIQETNAPEEKLGYAVWSGSLDYGEYVPMEITYRSTAFPNATKVTYLPFDDSYAYDELAEDKIGFNVLMIFLIVGIFVIEIILIDGFVSYRRGRGFIRGYGYHMHTYGYVNPYYRRAYHRHNASHRSSGGGGRGCACACACACAGGGRAGCSQKDTVAIKKRTHASHQTEQ